MQFLKIGDCKPRGFIRDIMSKDLDTGFLGNLDKLVPEIMIKDDIYHKNRRTKEPLQLDLGTAEVEEVAFSQYQWWNAESQGNWLDGFIRTAILLEDHASIEKAKELILQRLGTERYIGIYEPDARYQESCENGELWAKTTLLRAAYALYCYSKDSKLLSRIINAVDEVMEGYRIDEATPFAAAKEDEALICCGISHGLMFVDVLYDMWKETKEEKYLKYANYLYESFSTSKHVDPDAKKENLLLENYLFEGHGVHTYEHLRAIALSKDDQVLVPSYLKKLENYLCPSGAPIGDEWVLSSGAEPSMTGYEYCSIHELLHSYLLLLEQSGNMDYADWAEWLLYNGALGARHPEKSLIAYLKSDNSYRMQSDFQFVQEHTHFNKQTRYKYSPTHQDAALCCVPNAGRIFPYFISSMWMQDENSVMKVLYGDSFLAFDDVTIEEKSNFPMCNNIKFIITCKNQKKFTLKLRIPKWCKKYQLDGVCYEATGRVIEITKKWSGQNEINLCFVPEIIKHRFSNGQQYFSYGGLLLALPIQSKEKIVKTHLIDGFYDFEYEPTETYDYFVPKNEEVMVKNNKFYVNLWNEENKKIETKELVPLMNTILRKVTFKEV